MPHLSSFKKKIFADKHLDLHTANRPYHCKTCGQSFFNMVQTNIVSLMSIEFFFFLGGGKFDGTSTDRYHSIFRLPN